MRVFVTGVSGLIGSNLAAAAARQSWDVLGAFSRTPVELDGVRTVCLDMADRKACVQAVTRFEPDVVIHAAGAVELGSYEKDPFIAQLELVGAEHTLAAARTVRARYVLVSCDWVYSGYRPPGVRFNERDMPDPVNAYGLAKLECERAAMRSNVNWLITRPGEVYGVNASRPPGGRQAERHVLERSGLTLRLIERMRRHDALRAPAGVHRCPTYAWDYAQRVCELIALGCEGIYNTGGPVALGRHEWLRLAASAFECDPALVMQGPTGVYLAACGEDTSVRLPANTSLSDDKTRAAIGAPAVGPMEGLSLMSRQLRRVIEPAELPAA
jgi:dTDP-4-dehydrorhamnose reductase